MATITFPLQPILDIIDRVKGLPKVPTSDDLFDAKFWPDGKILNSDGLTKAEMAKGGKDAAAFWPDASRIDTSKLGDTFSLVGDHGVYLLPNRKLADSAKKTGNIVYAKGCNPNTDPYAPDNKDALFGCDDGVLRIPTEWILIAQRNNNTELKIRLNQNSFYLDSKPVGNKPKVLTPGMIFTLYDKKYELLEKGQTRGSWRVKQLDTGQTFKVTAPQLKEAMFEL